MKSSAATDSKVLLTLSIVIMLVLGFVVSRGFIVEPTVIVDRQQVLQTPERVIGARKRNAVALQQATPPARDNAHT